MCSFCLLGGRVHVAFSQMDEVLQPAARKMRESAGAQTCVSDQVTVNCPANEVSSSRNSRNGAQLGQPVLYGAR